MRHMNNMDATVDPPNDQMNKWDHVWFWGKDDDGDGKAPHPLKKEFGEFDVARNTLNATLPSPSPSQTETVNMGLFERRHRRSLSEDMYLHMHPPSSSSNQAPTKEANHSNATKGPVLDTITSGKEYKFPEPANVTEQLKYEAQRSAYQRRGWKRNTKSLSDMEFEELKGFLDLGFTFQENEITPRLVRLLPGLQRLDKNQNLGFQDMLNRPLSEALFRSKASGSSLGLPANKACEADAMKEHLKCWAHSVASTVKTDW